MKILMLFVLLISGCTTYTYNVNIKVESLLGDAPIEFPIRNPHNPYYDGRRNY